ncbi:MAG: formylglycine-generating enzyme family protein [Akkermansiaceae bacterium]|jgi:formylglycine-generating enzyme required for sulfatase activity|nr:formylglycine-generating enzyme family protein [Akkermansiaceae bacterium]
MKGSPPILAALTALILLPAIRGDEEAAFGASMIQVEGGEYLPMFGAKAAKRKVASFLMDRLPVTNGDYLEFVKTHPQWRRSRVGRLYAAEGYLSHWKSDLELGPLAPPNAPVVNVSWFAARAYLKACGKRLPTEDEWEFAARSDETREDASQDSAYLARILAWYGMPNPSVLPPAQSGTVDFRGICGMHGLVWEWVRDFNNQMVSGSARNDTSLDRSLFCAGGTLGATDASNYAAFMRFAFRSCLEGSFTVPNLGFRGARDTSPIQSP